MPKVLIVDDSAFMRCELTRILESDPDIEIVGTARDGSDALEKIGRYKPDVITMDIEMPRMDGLTALQHIMITYNLPVIMISSLTQEGAEISLEALRLGAVDVIGKPSGTISLDIASQEQIIIQKIKTAAGIDCSKIHRAKAPAPKTESQPPSAPVKMVRTEASKFVIAIGVSTGGPNTLMKILPQLPQDLPAAVLIVQHMPPMFTKSFADRLNRACMLSVKEAEENDPIQNGCAYIAPGDFHMTVDRTKTKLRISKNPDNTLHRPSVDVMMKSVADTFGRKSMGVILTGMGKDGAESLKLLHDKGCVTIAESEKTAVVYGMPREAVNCGAVDHVLPNDKVADKIVELIHSLSVI